MPRDDSWPGDVAMETLSNMDGAGSCESVISMNSGYTSEDSMEHLSAEERACLMYLEETIEALEVQEDSGFSNDEPDAGLQAETAGLTRLNDTSSFKSDEFGGAEHRTPEPQTDAEDLCPPSSWILTTPESATGSEFPPSAPLPEALHVTKDGNGNLQIVRSSSPRPGGSGEASDADVGLIPPPSDFMDKPRPLELLTKAKELPPPFGSSGSRSGAAVDLEQLRQRAVGRRKSASPSVTQESPNMASFGPSPSAVASPPPEAAEPRSPPAVAPRPKKLPANIILKTHRSPGAGGSDGSSIHPVPATSDRGLSDAQRVRIEALRKLGLLKSDESDPGPAPSPKLSPKSRRSWGAPPSPISPAAPHTPPLSPANTFVLSPPPTSPRPLVAAPDRLPAPVGFSDQRGRQPSDHELSDVKELDVRAQTDTPPPTSTRQLTPPRILGIKSATLERSGRGLGSLMASLDSGEDGQLGGALSSPRQLRNNRPRPASLGSRAEFSSGHGGSLQADPAAGQQPDPRRSLPPNQHSRDAKKLPRSEGISVLICPRSENEADRRQALKKLGLLRD